MRLNVILTSFLLVFGVIYPCFAVKHAKKDFAVVEAYTQRIIPGVRNGKIQTETRFIILWKSSRHPEKFYWESNHMVQLCNVAKVHKVERNMNSHFPDGMDYRTETTDLSKISEGDTLQVSPLNNNVADIPAGMPKDLDSCLAYQLDNGKWRTFAITNIVKKRDISMP